MDGRTDGQTDRRTEISVLRAAWSQLKNTGQGIGTEACKLACVFAFDDINSGLDT